MTEELLETECGEVVYSRDMSRDSRFDAHQQVIIRLESTVARVEASIGRLESNSALVGERVAKAEGRLDGGDKPVWWKPVLLTILGGAVIAYLGWVGYSIGQQGTTLAAIKQSLNGLGVSVAASNPSSSAAQEQALASIKAAKEEKSPVSAKLIKEAGTSFIDTALWAPSAWPVAQALVSYRSDLNASEPLPISGKDAQPTDKFDPKWKIALGIFTQEINGRGHRSINFKTFPPSVPIAQAAAMEKLEDKPEAEKGPSFLVFKKVEFIATLDGYRLRNVVFSNTAIRYHGGPVEVENVYFINCHFEIELNDQGISFARAVLESPSVTFKVAATN